VIDWGGALRWLVDPNFDVRARVAGEGHATLFRTDQKVPQPRFDPLVEPVASIQRRLKQKFDPRGIFNVSNVDGEY